MNRMLYLLVALMLLSCFPSVQAQNPPGQVDLDCSPAAITLDASPGTENGSMDVMCTITNPHSEDEEIHLSGTADSGLSLGFLEGTEFNVSAGESVIVNVTVGANAGIDNATYAVSVTARVFSVNNVPSPTNVEDTSNMAVDVSAYSSYTVSYDAPLTFTVFTNDASQSIGDAVKMEHNGNALEYFQLNLTALNDALAPHNLTTSAPVITVALGVSETGPTLFEIFVGESSEGELNTSTWEALQNGSHRLTLSSTVAVESTADDQPCHACTSLIDVQVEIYAVESIVDAQVIGGVGEDPVPSVGVFATLAMISLAGIAVGRKHA